VVPVDIYIPGCPPSAGTIFEALVALAGGETPTLEGENLKYD
jgi:coenzyme F420-reducing hydrogenase gamma subunit